MAGCTIVRIDHPALHHTGLIRRVDECRARLSHCAVKDSGGTDYDDPDHSENQFFPRHFYVSTQLTFTLPTIPASMWPGIRQAKSTVPAWSNCHTKRSEEHTSDLHSLMRISYAVFCLKTIKKYHNNNHYTEIMYTKHTP